MVCAVLSAVINASAEPDPYNILFTTFQVPSMTFQFLSAQEKDVWVGLLSIYPLDVNIADAVIEPSVRVGSKNMELAVIAISRQVIIRFVIYTLYTYYILRYTT